MRTTDLFKSNRAADKITESIEKVFGKKLNLESFDLAQLEDARNKLRTQIHTVRSESGFNENLENDAFTQAQWMLDAINSEIAERQEFVADPGVAALDEAPADVYEMEYMFTGDDGETGDGTITYEVVDGEIDPTSLKGYCEGDGNNKLNDDWCTEMIQPGGYEHEEALAAVQEDYAEQSGNQEPDDNTDDGAALASAGHGSDEDYGDFPESAPPTAKGERMVKHIKKGYANDGKLTDKEKGIAYATAWKQHNKDKNEDMNTTEAYINNAKDAVNILADLRKQSKMAELGQGEPVRPNQLVNDLWDVMQWIEHNMKESIETESVENSGEDMTKLHEGEVQQATAVVTAKTMVDRVGRWIEELSGMENDQLIQLGDSIRDEMGQEQAKAFISTVAPAVQQALENLKSTREILATGVRMLTGEEQGAELLGTDPAPEAGGIDDLAGPAEPDALNAEPEAGADEFAAAEPAVGGAETAGREKRESIDYQNSLLKVLAG
jgi:hypothetical protein